MLNILERKGERIVAIAALALVVYISSLCLIGQVISALQSNKTISNVGAVKAIGVGVYSDQACTNEVTHIYWGLIEPNETLTVTLFILGTGNAPVSLSMHTESWQPPNASDYMSVTWNLEGLSLDPEQVLPADLNLYCSPDVTGITDFSFDIIIIGTG